MQYAEDDLLPISALEHLEFCPRQCALIHVDGLWTENAPTAEGRTLHRRVHDAPSEMVGGVRIVRGLRLCSYELGLCGVADVVEFHPADDQNGGGVALCNRRGLWRPFPVEYKRGRKKAKLSYWLQLCAQAMCLEEMLQTHITAGALFHGKSRRREVVELGPSLRARVKQRAEQLHQLLQSGTKPPPIAGPKCKLCSLAEHCMPHLPGSRSAQGYVERMIDDICAE